MIGLILAAMLSRAIESLLFGVDPLDGVTFSSVVLVLTISAALAAAGAVARAMRVSPAVMLRNDS